MPQKLCKVQVVSFIVSPSTSASRYILPPQGHTVIADVPMVTFKQTLFVYMRFEALLTWFCFGHVINSVAHGLHNAYVQLRTLERSVDLQVV